MMSWLIRLFLYMIVVIVGAVDIMIGIGFMVLLFVVALLTLLLDDWHKDVKRHGVKEDLF